MIMIKLRLSESLLCLFRETDTPKKETIAVRVEKGTTIKQILASQGINPLLVPMIAINNKKTDVHTPLETDETITLFGPLAGG